MWDWAPSATTATRPAGRDTASRRGRLPLRTCPSTAATRRVCSRTGSRGRWRTPLRGSSATSLVRPSARDHRGNRLRDYRHIQPDRPVLDVREVEAHEVVEGEPGAARDLPQAGHARQNAVARAVPVLEAPIVAQRKRARADDAHLPLHDVDHLGNLPTRVTRGSSRILKSAPSASFAASRLDWRSGASITIVRNLSIPNSRSPTPTLRSTKKIGPRESSLIAAATSSQSGKPIT